MLYGAQRDIQRYIDSLADELYFSVLTKLDPGTRNIDEGIIRQQIRKARGIPGKALSADIRNVTGSILKLPPDYLERGVDKLYYHPSNLGKIDAYVLTRLARYDLKRLSRSLSKASYIYDAIDAVVLPYKNKYAVVRGIGELAEEYDGSSLHLYKRFIEEYKDLNMLVDKAGFLLRAFFPRSKWVRRLRLLDPVSELLMAYTLASYVSIRKACQLKIQASGPCSSGQACTDLAPFRGWEGCRICSCSEGKLSPLPVHPDASQWPRLLSC